MEVKEKGHLNGLDGLILPGGESTSIVLIAESTGMVGYPPPPSQEWAASAVPFVDILQSILPHLRASSLVHCRSLCRIQRRQFGGLVRG